MRNKYPGTCFVCHTAVPAGTGWFQKNYQRKRPEGGKRGSGVPTPTIASAGAWIVRCTNCKGKGNTPA